ncbi:MAG TPA: DUF1778 domain-containing protein [Thermomicrobiales bacterium]|nr:DUF1778 domain-containing protein [Thermomicrobiales bacterium]
MSSKIDKRLTIRLSETQYALLRRAADHEGCSLASFVRRSATTRAQETMREREVLTLSPRDSRQFVEALLASDGPNDALRDAHAAYRAFIDAT